MKIIKKYFSVRLDVDYGVLYRSLFFNKVGGLKPAALLKNRLQRRRFPVNFAKFLKEPFLQNTPGLQPVIISQESSVRDL